MAPAFIVTVVFWLFVYPCELSVRREHGEGPTANYDNLLVHAKKIEEGKYSYNHITLVSLGYYFVQRARTHAHTHSRAHTHATHTRLLKPTHARTQARAHTHTHIDATTCYLIGLISKDDDSAFLSQVDSFVNHCDAYYLELDVSKTKEMVIDFRQTSPDPQLVDIKGSSVARVDTYK